MRYFIEGTLVVDLSLIDRIKEVIGGTVSYFIDKEDIITFYGTTHFESFPNLPIVEFLYVKYYPISDDDCGFVCYQ
jgi:hypothetical protein